MKARLIRPTTRTISAAEFKAKCLQLMDEVNEGRLVLVVTKRGKPVMRASAPLPIAPRGSFIGATKGCMTAHGDIVSAMPNEWAALED